VGDRQVVRRAERPALLEALRRTGTAPLRLSRVPSDQRSAPSWEARSGPPSRSVAPSRDDSSKNILVPPDHRSAAGRLRIRPCLSKRCVEQEAPLRIILGAFPSAQRSCWEAPDMTLLVEASRQADSSLI
jgi:hypothetical protein